MSQNVIVCLSVGDKYTDDYVYKLRSMTERFCKIDHDFVCITDKDLDVPTIKIPDASELEPVWYKIRMLDQPELRKYERKVFLDLDVVIHNDVDWLFTSGVTKLQVLDARWKPQWMVRSYLNTGCNSSVMLWKESAQIAHKFESGRDAYMCKYAGMDRFLWHEVRSEWEVIDNDEVYSYRHGASITDDTPRIIRPERSICIYHQLPKPHEELDYEPAKSHWK